MEFQELLVQTEINRDTKWEKQFLKLFPEQKFSLIYPDAKPGPDNWPYLWITTNDTQKEPEDSSKLLNWLWKRGIGMVLNPDKKMPDYVFPYGMIWYYAETGGFKADEEDGPKKEKMEYEIGKLSYGYPSKDYVPDYVRKILKEFFLQQGIYKPRWILLTEDQKTYDLCFSLEALKNPDEKEHQGILEAISWFLPNHFRLGLISEKNLPKFEEIN